MAQRKSLQSILEDNVPAPEPTAPVEPDEPGWAKPAEQPPADARYVPPLHRTALANCVLESLPEPGASGHDVALNMLTFHEYWMARSDPGELRERIHERLAAIVARG